MRIIAVGTQNFELQRRADSLSPRRDLILDFIVTQKPGQSDNEVATFYQCDEKGDRLIDLFTFSDDGIVILENLDKELLPPDFPYSRTTGGILVNSDVGVLEPVDEGKLQEIIEAEVARMANIDFT
jgi:hypothetical protein